MDKAHIPGHIQAQLKAKGYQPTLALVHTKHDDGTPALVKIIRDDDEIELMGGEEFVTMWMWRG